MVFRLAHISDVHLPVNWAGAARSALRGLSAKQALGLANFGLRRRHRHQRWAADAIVARLIADKVDHLAIGGDLVNTTLTSEIEDAVRWVSRIADALGPDAVSVVPGNHDAYSRTGLARFLTAMAPFSDRNPMSKTVAQLMSSDVETADLASADAGYPWVRRFENGTSAPVVVVGVSTGVPTPAFYAQGAFGSLQQSWLDALLAEGREEGCWRVVVIHHPPTPRLAGERCALIDGHEMASLLARHGAELVVHGHNHVRMLNTTPGPDGSSVPIVGVPSVSQVTGSPERLARAHVFRFDGAPGGPAQTGGGGGIHMTALGLSPGSRDVSELESVPLDALLSS